MTVAIRNLLLIICCVLTFDANATVVYQYTSPSDSSTFGSIEVDANVGDSYNYSTQFVNWNLNVAGISVIFGSSNISGCAGCNFIATVNDPFGPLNPAVTIGHIILSLFSVARIDGVCAGTTVGCVGAVGGSVVSDVVWNKVTPNPSSAPEPTTLALLALGLAGIGFRKHQHSSLRLSMAVSCRWVLLLIQPYATSPVRSAAIILRNFQPFHALLHRIRNSLNYWFTSYRRFCSLL